MRSEALKIRIVKAMELTARRAEGASPGGYTDAVKMLPVVTAREKAKKALLKELMDAEKASVALARRIRKVAAAVGRLPLDETRKTIVRP